MIGKIDLEYRPESYLRLQELERYLISQVKGTVLRRKLKALFEAGKHAEVQALFASGGVPKRALEELEAWHPMFKGGNYLPDTEDGQVEIARISIKSSTHDVTCVYARPDGDAIHYEVVDEYNGDTLQGPTEARTTKPMSLVELVDFFINAWSLIDVLRMSFGDDLEESLDFFSASSDFYPELDNLIRHRVREAFRPEPKGEDMSELFR